MALEIRDATTADAEAVVRLIQEMAAGDNHGSPITEQFVRDYLGSPLSHILLAESDGEVIGLLSYSIRPDLYHAAGSCYVEELIVHENARRQGVAGALLAELFARARAADCAEVSLSVMPDNAEAIRFYKDHGLVEEALFLETHLKR